MVASNEAVLSRMRRSGIGTVSPLMGLAVLAGAARTWSHALVLLPFLSSFPFFRFFPLSSSTTLAFLPSPPHLGFVLLVSAPCLTLASGPFCIRRSVACPVRGVRDTWKGRRLLLGLRFTSPLSLVGLSLSQLA